MPFNRRLVAAAVILVGSAFDLLRSGHPVNGIEILVVVSGITAALNNHRKRPFWLFLGIGFGAVLGSIMTHIWH